MRTNTSTSSTHTPGPWIVQNHNEICADNEHESFVAEVFDQTDEWKANARLIAAAPKMLKMLRRYASDCETRIEVLRDEMNEAGLTSEDEEAADLNDQVAHWQATKDGVVVLIAEAEGRVSYSPPLP